MIYLNNKRYYTLDNFYKQKFGSKIAKVSLNANFTCLNRDGTKGEGKAGNGENESCLFRREMQMLGYVGGHPKYHRGTDNTGNQGDEGKLYDLAL